MPWWVLVLMLSESWGIPPWIIEDEANTEWVQRYFIYRKAVAENNEENRGTNIDGLLK